MREKNEIVLWPVYFDSARTRTEGRKVPKRLARPTPTLSMLEKALESIGIPHKSVPEAAYPYSPWRKTGLIFARKVKPKRQILFDVAKELSRPEI